MKNNASDASGNDAAKTNVALNVEGEPRQLTPEAQRALAEAEERRRQRALAEAEAGDRPKELGGRDGPDPARYGDWENGGIASDF